MKKNKAQKATSQMLELFHDQATNCKSLFLRLLITVALFNASPLSAADVLWEEKYFNPKPADDDVILPLPCGGAMVFRRINVESTGLLSDVSVDLGSSEDLWGYSENTLVRHIAGSFTSNTASERFFLLGKYEVSQLQYQSVFEEDCPKPAAKLRQPQNEVGWFDAVSFSDKLSQWLLKHAVDSLPSEQGVPGFVRLPTETEWEYATRGGGNVSISDFRERTFPMPDGLERYAWFAGTRSANGKMQLTGLLSPNPLGVHDILGNVDEIVWDSFRLNRLNRLHGQVGGYIVRGGNYFTADQDIRSSHREEVPYFDANGSRRSKTTGFRVVVSAPVVVSKERLSEIQGAWSALGREKQPDGAESAPAAGNNVSDEVQDDPVIELAILSKAATDKNMKSRLQRLESIMRATLDARDRQRDTAARANLRMGGVICQQVGEDSNLINVLLRRHEQFCTEVSDEEPIFSPEECETRKQQLDVNEARYMQNVGVYADSIIEVARNYDANILKEQKNFLMAELTDSEGGRRLSEFVEVHSALAMSYTEDWLVKRDSWSAACQQVYEAR